MSEGSDTNPETRIVELHKRRDAIDAEIALVAEAAKVTEVSGAELGDRDSNPDSQSQNLASCR